MNEENDKKIVNRIIIATIVTLLSLLVIIAIVVVGVSLVTISGKSNNLDYTSRIENALKMVQNKYIEDVDTETLIDGAISGIARATGDPYTRYMDEKEYNELLTSGKESYGGLGIHITYDTETEGIIILGIMPESPALEAGVKIGDIILGVDGIAVNSKTYNECVDKLKGEPETEVSLIIKRGEEAIEVKVKRKEILPNNVESEILENNIGYIRIWSFDNNVYKQFKTEYDKLRAQNIKGLVIDVRNNPGGLVADTVSILKEMLPKCDIVKLVYKDQSEKVYKCDGKNKIDIPLAVLVNSKSASASEILASAIKDSEVGVVVGTNTYGKGIVQEVEPLEGKGALSITVAKYYTISGVEIHKNGIKPNYEVELPEEFVNANSIPKDKDTQLLKAIEYIKSKM